MIDVIFDKLDHRAKPPFNAYGNDAGWDLFCLEDTIVPIGIPTDVRTGIAVAIPDGYYGRIVHRSSAPRKRRVMVLEGIIDAGFRGELFACAYTWAFPYGAFGETPPSVLINAGESIAQLIIQKVEPVRWNFGTLPASERGEKGFGSSGH